MTRSARSTAPRRPPGTSSADAFVSQVSPPDRLAVAPTAVESVVHDQCRGGFPAGGLRDRTRRACRPRHGAAARGRVGGHFGVHAKPDGGSHLSACRAPRGPRGQGKLRGLLAGAADRVGHLLAAGAVLPFDAASALSAVTDPPGLSAARRPDPSTAARYGDVRSSRACRSAVPKPRRVSAVAASIVTAATAAGQGQLAVRARAGQRLGELRVRGTGQGRQRARRADFATVGEFSRCSPR